MTLTAKKKKKERKELKVEIEQKPEMRLEKCKCKDLGVGHTLDPYVEASVEREGWSFICKMHGAPKRSISWPEVELRSGRKVSAEAS